MCPLQRPRPSPPADADIRLPCSGPCDVGTLRAPEPVANLKFLKKFHFLKKWLLYICFVRRPACILDLFFL
ncbi:unnamed protein product, partial [Staurois parvus]